MRAATVNVLLQGVARIFKEAISLRNTAYRRGWMKTRRLSCPVISVGNLSVGGTGKTPLVVLVAKVLLSGGYRPSILTRGYGRRRGKDLIVLDPGSDLVFDPRVVGDEPAVLSRALPEIPIIVSADRYRAGRLAERGYHSSVHLLDDGFQHLALSRDLDVVLLDVTRASASLELLPAGRMREPFSALERAHWVVLTRTELADGSGLQARVQAANPRARIFHCSTKFSGLADVRNGLVEPHDNLLHKRIAAFCGVGNPAAFFGDLRVWGFEVLAEQAFGDHHVYNHQELDKFVALAQRGGAEAILTTEKDRMNLPRNWFPDLPLFVCRAEAEIAEKTAFERALLAEVEGAGRRKL